MDSAVQGSETAGFVAVEDLIRQFKQAVDARAVKNAAAEALKHEERLRNDQALAQKVRALNAKEAHLRVIEAKLKQRYDDVRRKEARIAERERAVVEAIKHLTSTLQHQTSQLSERPSLPQSKKVAMTAAASVEHQRDTQYAKNASNKPQCTPSTASTLTVSAAADANEDIPPSAPSSFHSDPQAMINNMVQIEEVQAAAGAAVEPMQGVESNTAAVGSVISGASVRPVTAAGSRFFGAGRSSRADEPAFPTVVDAMSETSDADDDYDIVSVCDRQDRESNVSPTAAAATVAVSNQSHPMMPPPIAGLRQAAYAARVADGLIPPNMQGGVRGETQCTSPPQEARQRGRTGQAVLGHPGIMSAEEAEAWPPPRPAGVDGEQLWY